MSSALAPVVVAVDRLGSAAAVRFGALEAVRTGRPLQLVHVAPEQNGWQTSIGQDALRTAVARAEEVVAQQVPVSGTLVHGAVLVELSRCAATAALLVMDQLPAALHRVPTSQTTADVAGVLDTPVAVVPVNWIETHRGVVTLGLDPSAVDEPAVRAGLAIARLRRSVLRVVVSGGASRAEVDELLRRLGGDACDLAVELGEGPADAALRTAAATSDLLVVGRRRPGQPEGKRLGPLGQALLTEVTCPVLFTAPGHAHHHPGTPGDILEEEVMHARPGDRIVIRSGQLGAPVRDGEVVAVDHPDGTPPFLVRWSDTGHESLFFPGPDAYIDRLGPTYEPEYDASRSG